MTSTGPYFSSPQSGATGKEPSRSPSEPRSIVSAYALPASVKPRAAVANTHSVSASVFKRMLLTHLAGGTSNASTAWITHVVVQPVARCGPLAASLAALRAPGARHRAKVADVAFDNAEGVLSAIREAGVIAERVVTTSQGEVAFYFRGNERLAGGAARRYATIVCDSDGDRTALLADRVSNESEAWRVEGSVANALARIESFLEGGDENASD